MSHPIPNQVPKTLRAGDTVTWRRTLPDYPAGEGWSLVYTMVKLYQQITLTATPDGNDHLVESPVATTSNWAPGIYAWIERAIQDGKAYTVDTGVLEILPGFAAATNGLDARSHAQKTLDALEAWIESRDMGVAEYQIGDRMLKSIPIRDLLLLRDRYRREVRDESGKKVSGRVMVRF